MKGLYTFLCLLISSTCFAQVNLDRYVGKWDGFGSLEINNGKFFLISELSIETIPGRSDSLKCVFTTIPDDHNWFMPSKIETHIINAGVKDNYLIFPTRKNIYLFNKDVRFNLNNKNGKIYAYSNFIITKGEFTGNAEYYFSKSDIIEKTSFHADIENCYKTRSEKSKKDFMATGVLKKYNLSNDLSKKILNDFERREFSECAKENIDFNNIKYSYIKEIRLLKVVIPNLTPMYFQLDEEKAKELVASKAAIFEFEDFDYSLGLNSVISPKVARMKSPLSNLNLYYADITRGQIVFDKKFSEFIRHGFVK